MPECAGWRAGATGAELIFRAYSCYYSADRTALPQSWRPRRLMPTPCLSSEEYDERAHQHYNEAQYDDAIKVLREGLGIYPNSVELHVGVGYAQLAREEYAWARRAFEQALVLEPDHEDALAGLGETLLKLGHEEG